jgi:hypothetical protein
MELNCLQTAQTRNFMAFTQLISARNVALSHTTDLCSLDFTECATYFRTKVLG